MGDVACLSDVKVLDFSRLIPGAQTTRKLAALGAHVLKVEFLPKGDYLRDIPPLAEGTGIFHRLLNRGKYSVPLDRTSQDDMALLERLANAADVIVLSGLPRSAAALGIDLDGLRQRRRELVVCWITGFGQSGPLAEVPAHGLNVDSYAGAFPIESTPTGLRIAPGVFTSIGVELGAANAALAIVAAVLQARGTGTGATLDIACWDAAVEAQRLRFFELTAFGSVQTDVAGLGPLYAVYETSDGGAILFAAIERKFWVHFCDAVDRPDLKKVWTSDGDVSLGDSAPLQKELQEIFMKRTIADWRQFFEATAIPASPVLTPEDVLREPHFTSRGLAETTDAANGIILGEPIVVDGTRAGRGLRPAPALARDPEAEALIDNWIGRADSA